MDNNSVNKLQASKNSINFHAYYSEALKFSKSNPRKAIESINKAFEYADNDETRKKSFQIRGYCYLKLRLVDEALFDADQALSFDKYDTKSLYLKAESLYSSGQFEWSLLYYHQGKRLCNGNRMFQIGINKTCQAIENSVGTNKIKLSLDGDLSYFSESSSVENIKKFMLHDALYNKSTCVSNRKKGIDIKQNVAKCLLGPLHKDYKYFKEITKNEVYNNTKSEFACVMQKLCDDGLNYLDSKLEFFRQQATEVTYPHNSKKKV